MSSYYSAFPTMPGTNVYRGAPISQDQIQRTQAMMQAEQEKVQAALASQQAQAQARIQALRSRNTSASGASIANTNAGASTSSTASSATATPSTASTISQYNALTAAANRNFYSAMNRISPDSYAMVREMSGLARQEMTGALPDDVRELVEMYAAERAVEGGISGSESERFATARDIGKTSLEVSQQGFTNAAQVLQSVRQNLMPAEVDIGQLHSASQQYALGMRQTDIQAQSIPLDWARLSQQQVQFNATQAWDRELSAMNRAFSQWAINESNASRERSEQAARTMPLPQSRQATIFDRAIGLQYNLADPKMKIAA